MKILCATPTKTQAYILNIGCKSYNPSSFLILQFTQAKYLRFSAFSVDYINHALEIHIDISNIGRKQQPQKLHVFRTNK